MAVSPFPERWSIAQAAMRADGVVIPPPAFDQHFGLGEAAEDLAVEQFVAKRPDEAFVIVRRRTRHPPDAVLMGGEASFRLLLWQDAIYAA